MELRFRMPNFENKNGAIARKEMDCMLRHTTEYGGRRK